MDITDGAPLPLDPSQLCHACDPGGFTFETTDELAGLTELIGQARAIEALRFGTGIHHRGYNVCVLGPSGMGKHTMVRQFLATKPADGHQPADWCYLNNFAQPHKPRAIRLPSGKGVELSSQMAQMVDYLRSAIPALFERDDYRAKAQAIQDEFTQRQETAFRELGEDAERQQIALLRTPAGFAFAATRGREVLPPEEFEKLPEDERRRVTEAMGRLEERLKKVLAQLPQWWKDRSERVKALNRETTLSAVQHAIDDLRARFSDLPAVLEYLDIVQQDMVEHADDFLKPDETNSVPGLTMSPLHAFNRYQVNVLVSNGNASGESGPPVISEDNPTYSNLVGRFEHVAQLGALVTDFTLIKPGALHRANGGYLLLDLRKVLMQPFAWDGLKRALQSREIRIESLGQIYSLVSTVSLEPEPIPLEVKVILFADRLFYYLLQQYDPEFGELFKVSADFEEHLERNADSHLLYARMVATLARNDSLLAFDRGAVARVIDYSARLVGDAQRLSTHLRSVADLLQEADFWARQSGDPTVTAAHVQQAVDMQVRRRERVKAELQQAILRGTLLIDTQGAVTGQINGLSVIDLGDFAFAQPTRITVTTRLGEGELVTIDREVNLSGAIHSKGVLILSAFMAARYARNTPLSLSASLVFEQSYGHIDGDSASLAELCVLLSDLAGVPVKQSLAVTGSVNQLGQVQAIGGVNEKIEGFFDICAVRGLTGDQGVLIPEANVKHLMLRADVVAAAAAGRFRIHAVDTVDQAATLLTGVPAGECDASGRYPAGTLNQRVAARLAELTAIRRAVSRKPGRKPGAAKVPG